MLCGVLDALSALSFSIAAALSRIVCATPFQRDSSSDVICSATRRLLMRCSTVSALVAAAPKAGWLCGAAACANWNVAVVAGAAQAALSVPASIVAPSRAATATERVTCADMAIGNVDMLLSLSAVWRHAVAVRLNNGGWGDGEVGRTTNWSCDSRSSAPGNYSLRRSGAICRDRPVGIQRFF